MSDDLHVKAHNALAAAIEMYRLVLQGYQDREKILLSNVQMLKTQLAEALQSRDAVHKPEAKREVSRDGGAGGDLTLDGGALGQGEQGKEVASAGQERPKQVGTEAHSVEIVKRTGRQVPENFRA